MGERFQPKDARYKLIDKGKRIYRDTITGAILTRREWQAATSAPRPATAPAPSSYAEPVEATPYRGDWSTPVAGAVEGAVPIADTAPPPPMMAATTIAEAADTATKAAASGSTVLANTIGEAIAMCLELVQQTKTAPENAWQVLGRKEWERVTRPAMRIGMRHLPVSMNLDEQNPDVVDGAELAKGIMYGITALWTNKQLYDREMRRLEQEYELEYDRQFGSGAYQAARAGAAGVPAEAAGGNGGSGRITTFPVRHRAASAPSGSTAAGAGGNTDAGSAGAKIRALYHKYPNSTGRPFGAA